MNLLPFWQWSSSDSKYKLSPITSKEAVRELSFNLHHLFASKESCTACHADLNFPSELRTGTKHGGLLFSREKPTGALLGERGEVVRKEHRKKGKMILRDQRKEFWEVTEFKLGWCLMLNGWLYPPSRPCLLNILCWKTWFKTRLALRRSQWTETDDESRMGRWGRAHSVVNPEARSAIVGGEPWGTQMWWGCPEGRGYPGNKGFLTRSKKQDLKAERNGALGK